MGRAKLAKCVDPVGVRRKLSTWKHLQYRARSRLLLKPGHKAEQRRLPRAFFPTKNRVLIAQGIGVERQRNKRTCRRLDIGIADDLQAALRDYTDRDQQFGRIAGTLQTVFPQPVVNTAVALAVLYALATRARSTDPAHAPLTQTSPPVHASAGAQRAQSLAKRAHTKVRRFLGLTGTPDQIVAYCAELVEAGVPREHIVLGFRPPELRPYTGFAA